LESEHDNIRSALSWTLAGPSDPEPGLQIAANLIRFWDLQGYLHEGEAWLTRLLALPGVHARRTPGWASALAARGYLAATRGEQTLALRALDESLHYWRSNGYRPALATALWLHGYTLAWPAADAASWAEAVPSFRESLTLARQAGPRWATYLSLYCLAEAARLNHEHERAEALIIESVALARQAGDGWSASLAEISLGWQVLLRGDSERARACGLESLDQMSELGDVRRGSYALETLGAVAAVTGQPVRAARLFGAAEALREPIGDLMPASVRPERAKSVAAARALLSASEFDAAWAAGRAMPLDVAVTYARTAEPTRPADTSYEPAPARLTRREREVLALVARGNTNREIAGALVVSHRTVKRHLDNIFAKLGVSSRTAAATEGLRSGLV
jgi:non-specific serine/threonine protein kinase